MPKDDRDKFAAERLHPKGPNWCCRPLAVIQPRALGGSNAIRLQGAVGSRIIR